MDFKLHLIIVIAVALGCLLSFIKRRRAHDIVIAIWADSTLLQYLSDNRTFILILGVAQIALFLLVVYLLFKRKPQEKAGASAILKSIAEEEKRNENGEN